MSGKKLAAWSDRRISLCLCLFLALGTLWMYWPAIHCDFVNYDDTVYVTENPQVQAGLTPGNLEWAFTTGHAANWHPLTWLSLMLNVNLFGPEAPGFHFINVVLHAINVVLLFWLLRALTGTTWRSVLVAALFACHPTQVEAVAWVSERKTVLAAGFGLLTLLFYTWYARGRSMHEGGRVQAGNSSFFILHSSFAYWLSWLCLGLGLLSKPMLVTWPFVLLLLDYWPLGRWQPGRIWVLIREKIPFLALALATSAATVIVHQKGGDMVPATGLSLGARAANALISYCAYLEKLFWPVDLAVLYPHPGSWPVEQVILAVVFLAGVSVLCFAQRRRHPGLLIGWLWYLGTLVPMAGLVQVGVQAMADRHLYLSSVGVWLLVVWGVFELTRDRRGQMIIWSLAASVAIIALVSVTRRQMSYWREGETLFRHTLAVTQNNFIAHNNLGAALDHKGEIDEALDQFKQALQIHPDFPDARVNLGRMLARRQQTPAAIREFQEVLRSHPDNAVAHYNLGLALLEQGQADAAAAEFQQAIRAEPDYLEARRSLALVLLNEGHADEAIRQFSQTLRASADDAGARNSFGMELVKEGRTDAAIEQFRAALRLDPKYAPAGYNLAVVLTKQGKIDEAISQFRQAIQLRPDEANSHNDLGMLLVKKGEAEAAIHEFQEAIRCAPDYAEAHNQLGALLFKKGDAAAAIDHYRTAVRLKPGYGEAHNNLGTALASQGQTDAAISEFQAAVRLSPNDFSGHDNLGIALTAKGDTSAAIAQFQQALQLRPDDPEAENDLGYLWVERGEHLAEARSLIEAAVKSDPHNNDFLGSLGWVLLKLGQPGNALNYLQKAVANANPPDAELFDHLGDAYAALKQPEQAQEAWRKSLAIKPDPQVRQKLD